MKRSLPVLAASLAVALSSSCGSSSTPPIDRPTDPGDTVAPTAAPSAPAHEPTNEPPEFEIPAWRTVGIGQQIDFGLEVIDHESDEIRVTLTEKPATAQFDPYTLTVVWTPTREDLPVGYFSARIEERQRDTGVTRVFQHNFAIAVSKSKQDKPTAGPLGASVETLITIHDPERLAAVQKRWPIDTLLHHSAKLAHAALPEAERNATKVPSAQELYESFLIQFAKAHDNPAVDPRAKGFDRDGFGDPKKWTLIAVRPRLDKSWNELRVVYRAPAHAATYAMFKLRPTFDDLTTDEQRVFNNKTFAQMVFDAFFTKEGVLDPRFARDKAAHAKAVESFMTGLLTYETDQHAWAGGTFLGLPCEARLGGGSKRGTDGAYESGDGWGWNVQKVKPKDGKMSYVNVPIKGFATAVSPSKDNRAWAMTCAPKFDPNSDAHDPKFTSLCRGSGHVDMPAAAEGYTDSDPTSADKRVSSFVDAVHLFLEHKSKDMIEKLPLRDPRRDLFEEKGMTCSQCHVRRFGVRDMYDASAYDPSAGVPTRLNKLTATTFFVIVPTERWQPYAIDFQHKQECKFKAALEKSLGIDTSLQCPLRAE
jgi:hypothetical protein